MKEKKVQRSVPRCERSTERKRQELTNLHHANRKPSRKREVEKDVKVSFPSSLMRKRKQQAVKAHLPAARNEGDATLLFNQPPALSDEAHNKILTPRPTYYVLRGREMKGWKEGARRRSVRTSPTGGRQGEQSASPSNRARAREEKRSYFSVGLSYDGDLDRDPIPTGRVRLGGQEAEEASARRRKSGTRGSTYDVARRSGKVGLELEDAERSTQSHSRGGARREDVG